MLTSKEVRVRYHKDRIMPCYLDSDDETLQLAETMLDLFRSMVGQTQGELDDLFEETFGDDNNTLLQQGLAKLLKDRCEFETTAGESPDVVRATVFKTATAARTADIPGDEAPRAFDRKAVLESAARDLKMSVEDIERGLYADLKSEQRLTKFEDITAERLIERYNVALAQAVLLRATKINVTLTNEPTTRYRQLLRSLKFHRLLCEVERVSENSHVFKIDGPLSLFSSSTKYGLQLAMFLPTVLLATDYSVEAELRWGTEKKVKKVLITPKDQLVSHALDHGMYVPPELNQFVESFRKRITKWELVEETEIYPLGNGFWVPDFVLRHKSSGKEVKLEVMGFWRKSSAVKHLMHLKRLVKEPFLLAVSDQLRMDEDLEELPAGIHRFKHMPLADEVARLAEQILTA
jgi:hypothetical protein